MKQTVFLILMMAYCTFRSLFDPFWAVLLYYGLAVLRPQAIWDWALPKDIRWSLFAALLAIFVSTLHITTNRRTMSRRKFVPMLLVFGVCLLASFLAAMNTTIAAKSGWEYAKILIILIVGSMVVVERKHVRYLGWMVFACLTYLVYEVNMMYLFDHRLDVFHNGYGGLDNNGAALLFAMLLPFCYYFFLAARRSWRWIYIACAVVAMHAIMLTYSRGAMLSALVVGVMMVVTSLRRRLFQATCAGVIFVAAVAMLAGPEVQHRFLSIFQTRFDGSAQSRLDSWRAGWQIAKDHPLVGVGLRNSNLVSKEYGADIAGRTIHNLYIQVAADSGLPAAAMLLGLIGGSLIWLRKGAKASRSRIDEYSFRWHHYICRAAFWSLVTFAFGSMFLSTENIELGYLLMLIAAVAPKLAEKQRIGQRIVAGACGPGRVGDVGHIRCIDFAGRRCVCSPA